jgi:hypothetical protein
VHVHIRGTVDWWLAPAQLRSFIFRFNWIALINQNLDIFN